MGSRCSAAAAVVNKPLLLHIETTDVRRAAIVATVNSSSFPFQLHSVVLLSPPSSWAAQSARRCCHGAVDVASPLLLVLLAGSILGHVMMHAWLRLKGYPNLSPKIKEGICQVMVHMWLDSEIIGGTGSNAASASSSSSAPSTSASLCGSLKKGKRSEFEKKIGAFFKHQIESDYSTDCGDGFREGNWVVHEYGLRSTVDHIRLTRSFLC
ncbi:hypothetical protein SASPL_131182 [Salvia splendens]|uniref:Protein DA1-like domain-containing protein n=1 Tax=Salvia splendens TaxID=180675 RepID=A0A8X8ZKR9_SALSN|nr:hypothetical protein SASPL_131182 [Salvia splendens]